jgi:hypothetical protein
LLRVVVEVALEAITAHLAAAVPVDLELARDLVLLPVVITRLLSALVAALVQTETILYSAPLLQPLAVAVVVLPIPPQEITAVLAAAGALMRHLLLGRAVLAIRLALLRLKVTMEETAQQHLQIGPAAAVVVLQQQEGMESIQMAALEAMEPHHLSADLLSLTQAAVVAAHKPAQAVQAVQAEVALGLLEPQQAPLKAPQIPVAVVEAERKHLRRALMEKQAAPVS